LNTGPRAITGMELRIRARRPMGPAARGTTTATEAQARAISTPRTYPAPASETVALRARQKRGRLVGLPRVPRTRVRGGQAGPGSVACPRASHRAAKDRTPAAPSAAGLTSGPPPPDGAPAARRRRPLLPPPRRGRSSTGRRGGGTRG